MVTLDELDPSSLAISCSVDGEIVQDDTTSNLIFGIGEIISRLSAVCTLVPGDLLFTGTPKGVGYSQDPPRFLHPGAMLETTIEGIGTMRNPCIAGRVDQSRSVGVPA